MVWFCLDRVSVKVLVSVVLDMMLSLMLRCIMVWVICGWMLLMM